MKRKSLLVILLAILSFGSFAQNEALIDSLKFVYARSKGNEKIVALTELSLLYFNESPENAFEAAYKAFYLATFTADPEMLSKAYFALGTLHYKTSSFDSAMCYMQNALKTTETNEESAVILDNLGMIYRDMNRYDSAIVSHNQALKMQQAMGNRDAVAACYKNIGNVYMQMAKYEDALNFFELSMKERAMEDDKKSIALLCNNISAAYVGLQKYSEALSYLTRAVNIQDEIGDKAGEAYTLNGIGNFYFRLKVYDKAQEYYTRSLEIRKKLGDKNDIAASQFNIATVHRDLENYREALKYYDLALKLREKTNNREGQALIYNAIGGAYKNQKMYDKAIENYEKALDINLKIGTPKSIASSYERLGMLCRDSLLVSKSSKLYNQATLFYSKAVEVYKGIGDSVNVARMYNFWGNMEKDLGNVVAANNDYDLSRKFYGKSKLGLAYVTFNKGKLCQETKNADAEKLLIEALNLAEQCEEKTLIRDVTFTLYQLKKQQKNLEQSLRYYEDYVEVKEELEADKNKERIAQMEFESDIKILENQNENQELKLREVEMKHSQIRNLIILLIIILLVISGFAFLLYRQFNQKKKAYGLLAQKQYEVESAYSDIKTVNDVLEKKNNQILDSLTYAKRLQKAILPTNEELAEVFPQNFIFYMPKEIVSGDFYWLSKMKQYTYFAVVDCTGHGVPGACMSMVGNTLLNNIINEKQIASPAEILKMLDAEIVKTLRQHEGEDSQEDGLAISLIRYDKKNSEIVFAGAGQTIMVVSDGDIQTVPSSLFSIGGAALKESNETINEITIPVKKGTLVYLYSDGYLDQFSSEKNERFSSSRFEDMISEMQSMDMSEQYINLLRRLDAWKGTEKQLDDILVVGLKF